MSKIEWTDETWNPVVGCERVSAGCRHCYAERMAGRLARMGLAQYAAVTANGRWNGRVELVESALAKPLAWKRPRRVFVDSMSDLFHDGVEPGWVDEVLAIMTLTPQHSYQVLTKRPQRMRAYFRDDDLLRRVFARVRARGGAGAIIPLPNLWLGVSVEDQRAADRRVAELAATRAAVRFLSCEPLLGPLRLDLAGIDWVIVGGESGPGARPMDADWVRGVRDQCLAAGVKFFFKQWGGVQKGKMGRVLDGEEWNQWPGE